MPANIPGFYYDEEKKKYFRIQKNHVLPTSSAVYTRQSVQAAEERKQTIIQQERRAHKTHVGYVRRAPVASELSYKTLEHRLGRVWSSRQLVAEDFAWNISPKHAFGSNTLNIPLERNLLASSFHISHEGHLTGLFKDPLVSFACHRPNEYGCRQGFLYTVTGPTVEVRRTSAYGDRAEIITGFPSSSCGWTVTSDGGQLLSLHRMQGLREARVFPLDGDDEEISIWDIATSPYNGDIAVATTQGLYLTNLGHTRPFRVESGPAQNAQMNVSFKDANIVVSGQRSGRVNFCDIRNKQSVVRLWHSSAVLGTIATQHAEQVIVHGFSSTSIYDLRYTKAVRNRGGKRSSTNPYIDLAIPRDRTTDSYTYGRKQAYSADMGILVLASSSSWLSTSPVSHLSRRSATKPQPNRNPTPQSNPMVQQTRRSHVSLYSTKTGKLLRSPKLSDEPFTDPVTCVDIKRVREGYGCESIFTLSGKELTEWSMHREDDEV